MIISVRTVFRALPPIPMRTFSVLAAALTLSTGFAPLSALAATTDAVSAEQVMQVLEEKAPADAGRGGGIAAESMYYPGPYGGGISVDASVTKEVTPDFVAVNGYCEVTGLDSRDDVRVQLAKLFTAIKADVGSDGRVRRTGSPSIYPYYDAYAGTPTSKMSGSLSVFIRVVRSESAQKIADILDKNGCSPNWDVRLLNTEDYEMNVLDDLIARVNKRKKVFEKLLGKKLTNVSGASLSTWVDGWSTYDPETNKADATTTLSITFDASRSRVTPMIDAKEMPKG